VFLCSRRSHSSTFGSFVSHNSVNWCFTISREIIEHSTVLIHSRGLSAVLVDPPNVAVHKHPFKLFCGKRRINRAIHYFVLRNASTARNDLCIMPTVAMACEMIRIPSRDKSCTHPTFLPFIVTFLMQKYILTAGCETFSERN
jgi:hypothetical protein